MLARPARPSATTRTSSSGPTHTSADITLPCLNFVLACDLYYTEFPELSVTQWISTVIQRLSGRAMEWAAAACRVGGTLTTNYAAFVQEFLDNFDHPDQGKSRLQKLLLLHQGSVSVADPSSSGRWPSLHDFAKVSTLTSSLSTSPRSEREQQGAFRSCYALPSSRFTRTLRS